MVNKELDVYVKSFKQGNDEAFDVIYDETKKLIYLSIHPIINSNSLTEDLMQETYMKAIKSLESYKIGTNFKAWICRIAHNLAINEYNSRKKVESLDEENMLEIEDKSPQNSLLDSAYEILNRDPKTYEKEIFTYRIVCDMKFSDISTILDLPKSTVFNIYNRIIKKIKDNI